MNPAPVPPPSSDAELLERARALAGRSLGELALQRGLAVPPDLRRAKGWVGTLLEGMLGATASSRAAPDFEGLGIELKTIPVGHHGEPLESTFVCTIPLVDVGGVEWEDSRVFRKLRRVLWVPVQGSRELPVAERAVGAALLWSPSAEEQAALRHDWEELAGLIGRGDVESITGHLGTYLQIRPKAANSQSRRRGTDVDGVSFAALPRGFYLRSRFTAGILRQYFVLPQRDT